MSFASQVITSILDRINQKRIYVPNYFQSAFQKKVLISYITNPFLNKIESNHSNNAEAIEIAKSFHEKGYQVDIVRYNATFENIKFKNDFYDVVFGLEPNFLKAIKKFNPKKSIYYATGAYYIFQNESEKMRLIDLQKRKGVLLNPRRYVEPHESAMLADAVICIGNEWTVSTYKTHVRHIERIPVSAHSCFSFDEIQSQKNWSIARKNFLWFGSAGAVHKGLDLLLEIFLRNPEIHLYVCGGVRDERDFFDLYEKELLHTKNIHFVDWINPDSGEFKKNATECAFTIIPSCSEGMSSSVVTCMQVGMVPLVSKECGLSVESCGVVFDNSSIENIENEIINYSKKDDLWLKEKSKKSYEFAQKNNTIENFTVRFSEALDKII